MVIRRTDVIWSDTDIQRKILLVNQVKFEITVASSLKARRALCLSLERIRNKCKNGFMQYRSNTSGLD